MVARLIAGATGVAALLVVLVAVLATTAGGDVRAEVVTDTVDGLPTADRAAGVAAATGGGPGAGGDHPAGAVLSQPTAMPIAFSLVGFSAPAGAGVAFRHRDAGGTWSDWEVAEFDPAEGPARPARRADAAAAGDRADRVTSRPVWTGAADELQLRATGARPEQVTVNLVDGLGQNRSGAERVSDLGAAVARTLGDAATAPAAVAAQRPDITSRAEWGARPSGAPSYAASARGAVLHHTVTSNSYGPSQGPAIVRSIQSYHQDHQGWKDIGYNFLVDRHGRIYQGRAGALTEPVVGAHAAGHNTGTIGVAFIGQHHAGTGGYQPLGPAAADAAVRLLAWLFEAHGIDPATPARLPSGYTYQTVTHRIVGHGHLGGTSCPGSSVNAALAGLRADVVAAHGASGRRGPAGSGADLRIAEDHAGVARLAGTSRRATAARVSRHAFEVADTVVVASAAAYPDALAGAGLAGRLDAPVLLTSPGDLDGATAAEVERLGARRAIVLGSPTAVSRRVAAQLRQLGLAVRRLAGADRFATAAAVAERLDDAATVLVADGADGWPDAVSASQLAAAEGIPVLLTAGGHLPEASRQAVANLDPDNIIIVGGDRTVPARVARQLARYGRVTRLAGADRVHTAAHVTNLMAHVGADKQRLWLASAGGWPDALAAGPAVAHVGGVLQLTWPRELDEHGPVGRRVRAARALRLVGGPAAISPLVEHESVGLIGR